MCTGSGNLENPGKRLQAPESPWNLLNLRRIDFEILEMKGFKVELWVLEKLNWVLEKFWKTSWKLFLKKVMKPWITSHSEPYLFLSLISGQSRCKTCPENTYAMPGASRCIPLLNCTSDDIIAAPGDVNSCLCEPSPNGFECNTTVKPEYIKVHGKLHEVLNPFVLRSDQWVISP